MNEYIGTPWLVIAITTPLFGIIALLAPALRFLLFIPIGILFSVGPLYSPGAGITSFEGTKIDLEGTVYKSPEKKETGSRLFLDTEYAIADGVPEPVNGKVIISTAEDAPGISYGDRIRVIGVKLKPVTNFRNEGAFDVRKYYERQGVYATGFVEGSEYIISFGRDKSYSSVIYSLDRLRLRYGNFVRTNFPPPGNEILNALTIGDDGGIPPGARVEFSKAGVAHVLSVSGLHVGAVAVVFFLLIKWLLKRSEYMMLRFKVMKIAAALTILPLFFYTAVAGFNTPAVRAFIMISVFFLAIMAGRDENKLNTLGVAGFVILLWHPWSLFELSFQLSFAAVLGILLAHKFFPFRFGTLRDKAATLVKTTCAATFATFPLIINSFGILPLVSVPANIVLVPLVELLIVPLGLLSFLVFMISERIAWALISINIHFINMMVFGIGLLLDIPYSSLTIPPLGALSLLLFFALGIAILLAGRYGRIKFILPAIALAFVLSAAYPVIERYRGRGLTASFLDAGEDKSIVFFELPGGRNLLIDGGYSNLDRKGYIERNVAGRFLLHSGVNGIDILILTSTDKDHMSGAKYLLENFRVGKVITNGDKLDGGLWGIIKEKGINWQDLAGMDEIPLGDGSKLEVFKPGGDFVIRDSSLPRPLALRLAFENRIFLTGESLGDAKALSALTGTYGERLRSDVLFISPVITDEAFSSFLNEVSPRILVTGEHDPSLMADDVPLRESLRHVAVFDTSVLGEVTVETDGTDLSAESYGSEKKVDLK
ncbi:MAG: ComEC/Rec2 family competence protein [Thermodesulfobacteriota bacterium]